MTYEELKREMEKYPETMSAGERMQKYAAGEVVDHIPFSLQSNEEAMANIFGYTTAQWRNDVKVHIDVIKRRQEEFNIGGLASGLRLRTMAQAVGSEIYFPEVGIDRVIKPVLTDYSMLPELMKDNPKKNPVFLAVLQRGIDLKMAFPEMGIAMPVAGPFTNASLIRPVEMILRDTVRNPEKLNDLLKWTVDYTVAYAEMFADEFGGGGCTICDPISCADILGKRNYRKFSHPWLEYLIEGLTQTLGKKPGIHICGKTSPLWDDMLKLKVSSFSVDNMENLADARDKMGPVFGLVGNVAPVDVMLNGTIDDVIETCKQCIINGSEAENGYTLGTGCQVPIGTSRENFDAFIFAARKYGRGARKGMLPLGIVEEAANDVVMNKA